MDIGTEMEDVKIAPGMMEMEVALGMEALLMVVVMDADVNVSSAGAEEEMEACLFWTIRSFSEE